MGFLESDGAALAFQGGAVVGARIEPPSATYETSGYIVEGRGYLPEAYRDPFTVGAANAALGAIIPVNTQPGDDTLKIWWFKRTAPTPASDTFQPFYTPAKVGTYTITYPTNAAQIVLASNAGSPVLSPAEAAGKVYIQNKRTEVGFNPNEEHAFKLADRVYALRDDLNIATGNAASYTSKPFVLLSYTEPSDGRPAVRVFEVLRETATVKFDYPITAGTRVYGPQPLPLMPAPIDENGLVKNREVPGGGTPDPATNAPTVPPANPNQRKVAADYNVFVFNDRKGDSWVYRGPHAGTFPSFAMRFYYKLAPGFYVPGFDDASQPAEGTLVPYLREAGETRPITDPNCLPLTILYRPQWPAVAKELRVGETLTLPKFGLPAVYAQTSAQVLYQQSVATGTNDRKSVELHDPLREKTYPLGTSGGLPKLPDSIQTTSGQGKTYFQGLPPHLQTRFYLDPNRGPKDANGKIQGTLVLVGTLVDEVAGEDYLNLNVLSAADLKALKDLAKTSATAERTLWESAVAGLTTKIESYVEDAAKAGSFKLQTAATPAAFAPRNVGARELATVAYSDTAVVNYALSATGKGQGWVSMIFGDGNVATPSGEPVSIEVFKVVARLGTGDLKVNLSGNPLDEQVSLRHSGDFAGKPEDYVFDWRYTPPVDGQAPALYTFSEAAAFLGNWLAVSDPVGTLPTEAEYAAVSSAALPRSVEIQRWIDAVTVTNPGVGYTTVPTVPAVEFVGGGGTGAAATAVVSPTGSITAITLTNPGSGYTSTPTVRLVGGGATTVATATVSRRALNDGFTGGTTRPGLVLKSTANANFSAGVPSKIVFSAALSDRNAGFVLYVNGVPALAYQAPASFTNSAAATAPLISTGALELQFAVPDRFFQRILSNRIEVALYTSSDAGITSSVDFKLHYFNEVDLVAGNATWQNPSAALSNQVVVGGDPTLPLGSALLVLSDNYFTMRYRPKTTAEMQAEITAGTRTGPIVTNVADPAVYSRWVPAKLVEGWIKRVLAGINPFNQRVGDLFNNAVNTDVSILTQAGKRWEGNVALNLANINDFGLIEIYETVLNRGKTISINAGVNYDGANDALLLAAGYLSDLYTVLGNEAYADAANPTISVDDSTTATEVSTSRFSFEGQVASVLEEELALLRGRDDFLAPGVKVTPAYNRMYWNYTRGINAGEALYAVNYNIREKAGSSTADGKLDAADAQRMFPQGHGDAYGHYLTALTGYSQLLRNPNFTWTPRAEAVTVLGQAVTVDYFDERKFAAAAANLARTAQQVIALTHRQTYKDDPAAGWSHLRDGKVNTSTDRTRSWGVDEWSSRATQGAYYHWLVGNALLPDVDNNTQHTGVQKIDRTTVPELSELPTLAMDFQAKIDLANSHLNPLGLSPNAIAFDISPSDLKAGQSHYDQIYARALRAVLNAKGAFDQAARMTRLLRNQENQVGDYNSAIVDQESAFEGQLTELYGTPYPGDVGPGKTYAQGYAGPDLLNWFVVDRPIDSVGAITLPANIRVQVPTNVTGVFAADLATVTRNTSVPQATFLERTLTIQQNPYVNFADTWPTAANRIDASGQRRVTGTLQQALLNAYQAELALRAGADALQNKHQVVVRRRQLASAMVAAHLGAIEEERSRGNEIARLREVQFGLETSGAAVNMVGDYLAAAGEPIKEAFPTVFGVAVADATSAARGAIWFASVTVGYALKAVGLSLTVGAQKVALQQEGEARKLDQNLTALGFNYEQAQSLFEYEQMVRELSGGLSEVAQLALTLQRANEHVRNLIAQGEGIMSDRATFRQRAAAIVQGYRTKDLTFRTFRNEALEQYRSLYDLAARYTYLSAKAYDYETGLLGSAAGQSAINAVVASRSLGDLTGGTPQATVSTLGDAGLAGTMARMQADWAVAEPRLGINNPDENGTLFSLRRELFRLTDDVTWRQTLEQHIRSNVMDDADVAAACRNLRKADGSAVPGIVIPFTTTIQKGFNFFGKELAVGDHSFSVSNYATKIYSAGVVLRGYIGLDAYAAGSPNAAAVNIADPNGLSATPYVYLIPTGTDYMLAPPLGDTGAVRAFTVHDQALPLPFNLGATAFSTTQFFNATGTLSEAPWIVRKHQAFRPVSDAAFFYSSMPTEFTNSRLVGRSVWNGGWKLVIPAFTLLRNEQDGLNRFVASVRDIELFLRTYSHSGN